MNKSDTSESRSTNCTTSPPQTSDIRHRYAALLLVTEDLEVVAQQRDDIPDIDNPGKLAPFGGTVEAGEEPVETVWRELTHEETNLSIPMAAIKPYADDVSWRSLTGEWQHRYFFYAAIPRDVLRTLEVYEGSGWDIVHGPDDSRIIENQRELLRNFFEDLHCGALTLAGRDGIISVRQPRRPPAHSDGHGPSSNPCGGDQAIEFVEH